MKAARFFDHRADKKFGEEIRSKLVRLFRECSAQLVENDEAEYREPRSFDYVVATVATPDLDLRFARVRGQFEIDISAPSRRRWDSLDSALLWLDMQHGIQGRSDIPNFNGLSWDSIDRFLVENWDRLKAAATASPYLRQGST